MWWILYLPLIAAPLLLGLVAATGAWASRRSRTAPSDIGGALSRGAMSAVVIGVGATILARFTGFPFWWSVPFEVRQWSWYAVPVAAAVVTTTCVLLTSGRSRRSAHAASGARPRTPVLPWAICLTVLTLLVVVVSVAAGRASSPDGHGRYTLYVVESGTAWLATASYGWYYSAPILALVAVLVIVTVTTIRCLGQTAHASGVARWCSRNVLAVANAALSLHLSAVLGALATAASTAAGAVRVWPGFNSSLEQLGTALRAGGYLTEIFGWFCWFTVVIAVVVPFIHHRRRETARSEVS